MRIYAENRNPKKVHDMLVYAAMLFRFGMVINALAGRLFVAGMILNQQSAQMRTHRAQTNREVCKT